jgi:hypothetical protein
MDSETAILRLRNIPWRVPYARQQLQDAVLSDEWCGAPIGLRGIWLFENEVCPKKAMLIIGKIR